jgi:hypothetical protein
VKSTANFAISALPFFIGELFVVESQSYVAVIEYSVPIDILSNSPVYILPFLVKSEAVYIS